MFPSLSVLLDLLQFSSGLYEEKLTYQPSDGDMELKVFFIKQERSVMFDPKYIFNHLIIVGVVNL